jgi:hypothetical protein
MRYVSIFFLPVLLAGCSAAQNLYLGSVQYPNSTELKVGMNRVDVDKLIGSQPVRTRTFAAPDDQSRQLTAVEYDEAFKDYWGKGKHYILFSDDKVVTQGLGDAASVEFGVYAAYFEYQRSNGRMNTADVERARLAKLRELFKLTTLDEEFLTYRVVVAGKVDRKEIDLDMANYLIAQKKAEVEAKLAAAEQGAQAAARADQMLRMQQSALMLQFLGTMQPYRQQPSLRANCTTTQMGNYWNTQCF